MNIVDTIVITCDVQWKQEVTLLENYNTTSLINVLRQPLASSTEKQKELTTAYYRLASDLLLNKISEEIQFLDLLDKPIYNRAIVNTSEFPDYLQRRLIKQATTIQATGVTGVQMQNALIYLSREGKPAGRIITKTESDYFVSSVITNLQKYSEPEAMYTLSDVFKLREEWRSQHGPFELFDIFSRQ